MLNDDIENLEITPADVESLIAVEDSTLQLIDVREEWEIARGILPNAVHLPLSRFLDFSEFWQRDGHYVIYCEHGIRSLDVVTWLAQNKGIEAKSMRGGFAEWQGEVRDGASGGKP